ncbi:DUF6169 family protein [Larkinella punicea]|nr:DUF6169 family protein [Larkinella punicea]
MNPKNRPESSSLRPTSYSLIRDKDSFTFTTDKGAIYKITFTQDAEYIDYLPFADDVYSFVLEQTSGEYKGRDLRMKQTVIETLGRFFENLPQAVIIYNCSQENDHEKTRYDLFNRWFDEFGDEYDKVNYSDLESREYASAIFRKDHPQRRLIEPAFNKVFREK